MLTIPNEIVPRQIARGVLADSPPLLGEGRVGARLRAVFWAIPDIKSIVPLAVLPLVLLAAVFHAAWNALLKASENPLSLATRAVTWGTAVSLPPVAVAWIVAGRPGLPLPGWPLLLAFGVLETLSLHPLVT